MAKLFDNYAFYRANIARDWASDLLNIYLGQTEYQDGPITKIALPLPDTNVVDLEPHTALADDRAWLQLPESAARALFEALTLHFGAVSTSRQLLEQLTLERKRCDRLIELLGAMKPLTT